jgi:hypothetical protein
MPILWSNWPNFYFINHHNTSLGEQLSLPLCGLSTKLKPDSRGLVPGIHVFRVSSTKAWMAGT